MNHLHNVRPPTPIQSTGAKKAGRKKADAKKALLTPVKKSASFKRKNKKFALLSPLAKSFHKKGGKKVKPKLLSADPADLSAIAVAHGAAASSGENVSMFKDHARASETLQQFHARMQKLGVPKELLPMAIPNGRLSYTIRSKKPGNRCSVQVLHDKGSFYITKNKDALPINTPTISWSQHASCADAWEFTKKLIGW